MSTTVRFVLRGVQFFCLAAFLQAQSDTSLISGFVRDPSGAAVPRAKVLARNETNGGERQTISDASGYYVVANLPTGHYTVLVEAKGFKTASITHNKLDASLPLQVSVSLTIGSIADSVEVAAQLNTVQSDTAAVGRTVTREQIENLQLNGRDPNVLAQLMPGVVRPGSISSFTFGIQNYQFNINGSHERENTFTIDGAPAVRFRAATTPVGVADLDATQEVQILTANYRAEYGRSAGGQIRVITKSGSKDFHGSAYEYFRNNALDANSWSRNLNPDPSINGGAAPFRFNQFGYNFSGPVTFPGVGFNRNRNKLFFLWSQEFLRYRQTVALTRLAPSLAMRAGDFSELLATNNYYGKAVTVKDPLNGNPFANNLIPATRLSTNGTGLLKAFPAPTPGYNIGGQNVFIQLGAPQDQRKETVSFDYLPNEKNFFRFRYLHDYYSQYAPTRGNWDRGQRWLIWYDQVGSMNYTRTISPTMVNEFVATFNLDRIANVLNRATPTWEKSQYGINIPFLFPAGKNRAFMIPNISIGGLVAMSTNQEGVSAAPLYTASDNLTKTIGRHILKAGFYFERAGVNDNGGSQETGAFTFSDSRTGAATSGVAMGNAALGLFDVYTELGNYNYTLYRTQMYEWYVQDSWKATDRLQVEIGLRHSLTQPFYAVWGNESFFDPRFYDPAKAAVVDRVTGVITGGDRFSGLVIPGNAFPSSLGGRLPFDPASVQSLFHGVPKTFSQFHKDYFQPRIGLAYAASKSSVVRAAFGRYVLRNPMSDAFGPGGNPPFQPSGYIANGNVDNPGGGASLIFPTNPGTQDPVLGSPQSFMWNASYEVALPAQMLLNVGYVGRHGYNSTRFININQMFPGTVQANPGVNQNALRPYRGYGSVISVVNDGQSRYNSFQLMLNRRYHKGLMYGLSYTLAKSEDNSSYGEVLPNTYNDKPFWGPSSFDYRNVVVVNFAYDVPFFQSARGLMRSVLGGWQVSGITQFQSGGPFTVQTGDDFAGVGGGSGSQIWNINGDPYLPKSDRQFANSTAEANYFFRPRNADGSLIFIAPATGTFTTQNNRNYLYNPGYQNWNASMKKSFRILERQSLQFRAELFNWINHPNWGGAGTSPTNLATFGKVLSKNSERNMQLSLRYSF